MRLKTQKKASALIQPFVKKIVSHAILLVLLFVYSCNSDNDSSNPSNLTDLAEKKVDMRNAETIEMANALQNLVTQGDPMDYIYWNEKRADLFKTQLQDPATPYHGQVWFDYCTQLLRAAKARECIAELESNFDRTVPLAAQMTPQNYLIFELLALAYLRAGEQENCQNAHTEFSCILPLQSPAFHQLQEGSSRALQLYQDMYDRHPTDSYKWLINLGYMTLGKHPDGVPEKYKINYPNWKMEQQNFPRFNEVATHVNAAINGLSGGICLDDFNNDGQIDIFATDYDMSGQSKLLLNNGKGSFTDHTVDAGLKGIVSGLNCVHADYNNDGFLDILVLRGAWLGGSGNHPNSLLKNNGDGTFSDVTKSAGIYSLHPTQAASWADYNRDGFLDIFIGNETGFGAENPCEIYKNNGDGTFTEASTETGLNNITRFIKGVTWGDINNDNWPDLFISCLGENLLYKNNLGKFEDISSSAGIQAPSASFACWFWDVNNDGYQDLFVAGYDVNAFDAVASSFAKELQNIPTDLSLPRLYINNGNETFADKTVAYQLNKPIFAMGANFGDLDNDGYLDFYLGTGSPEFDAVVPNRMFRNVNGKTFEEVTSAGGFGHIQKGHGIAFADIDGDGDQDIYAVMGGAFEGDNFTNVLFENPGFENNWIVLELEGTKTNKAAIGTRMELILDNNQKIYCTVGTGGSFGSSSLQQEIGLGKAKQIKQLTIFWQNGDPQQFNNLDVNQKLHFTEGNAAPKTIPYSYTPFAKGDGTHHHH